MSTARIRSIKPEFFDHEDLCRLTFAHRLCFAGLWCQADKAGRLEDRPERLKARIFPYDKVNMPALLTDLVAGGFIVRYVVAGKSYLAIPEDSWNEHQRPRDDEKESLLPPITYNVDTNPSLRSDEPVPSERTNPHTQERREKGEGSREILSRGNGEGEEDARLAVSHALTRAASCLEARVALKDAWNTETHPPIPRCLDVQTRRDKIASRLKERDLGQWREIFARIQRSPFCRGENNRNWKASFDWIIANPTNAVKVLEGKYDETRRVPALSDRTKRILGDDDVVLEHFRAK